ncbi:MAG TPA: hypothetical protein PLW86_16175, partial [Rhodocyclaceae bacterium]|nr:hypothetical protein [Rhodocyclaceae bacterium]
GKDAQQINFGGAQAGTYSGTLPNGLAARSYVVANNGYRLTILLKGPNRSPYKELMEAFASGLEQFRWATLQTPAAAPAAPSANDKTNAQTRDLASPPTRSDQSTLVDLLGGDSPLSPDRLQRYLSIALSHPPARTGFFQAGQRPDDWGTSVSRLVFSDKEKFKSLEFWTSIRGGDYLKDILKRNGAVIDRIPGSTVVSGEPKKELVPAITSEVVAWYSAKLRDRGQ